MTSMPRLAAGTGFIVLHNLTLGYERHPAVHHLNAAIPRGSLLAVVGPNGGGKSTLLKGMAGLLAPLEGRIDGLAGRRVAYLPQHAEIDRSFPIRVIDLVAMGLWHEIGALGGLSREQQRRCAAALAAVGLDGFERRTIDSLSGGQFQRALFARLSLQNAEVVLLDEPFAAIDGRTVDDLMQQLVAWQRAGTTVVVVLHDLDLVRRHCPQAMWLAREMVAFGPASEVIDGQHWQRAQPLREAWSPGARACERSVPDHPSVQRGELR